MIFSYPPAPNQYSQKQITDLSESIKRALLPGVSKDEAVGRVLLLSPNGTAYAVSVSDTGTLTVVKNDGKSRL